MPIFTFDQIAELERADGNADKAQDLHIEPLQQAPDVPVLAFVQHDFQPAFARALAQ